MTVLLKQSLKSLNTLQLAAMASNYLQATTDAEIIQGLKFAADNNLKPLIIGGGSNVVLSKSDYDFALHIVTNTIEVVTVATEVVYVKVAAGVIWDDLVKFCIDKKFYGLENLSLIPGTVGAAPMQNIGAYGVELQHFFHELEAIEIATGNKRKFTKEQCEFGYRNSIFKNKLKDKFIINSVTLKLHLKPQLNIDYFSIKNFIAQDNPAAITPEYVRDVVIKIRQKRLPNPQQIGNVGSFFTHAIVKPEIAKQAQQKIPQLLTYKLNTNEIKIPSGQLIEHCGWLGHKHGAVGIYQHNPLVIVNYGNATGKQVLEFADDIIKSVADEFAIKLHIEPRVY